MQRTYDWIWPYAHYVAPHSGEREPSMDLLNALFADGLSGVVFNRIESGRGAAHPSQYGERQAGNGRRAG